MGMFISTCVPNDATGLTVSLNTEYMYRDDGLKLEVLAFEYVKDSDPDFRWFVLTRENKYKTSRLADADRYRVSELYLEQPKVSNTAVALKGLKDLRSKLSNLMFALSFDDDTYYAVNKYALNNLDIEPHQFNAWDANSALRLVLNNFRNDLYNVTKLLENSDAE